MSEGLRHDEGGDSMTGTEELRALLDERGGWTTASGSECYTAWAVEHGIAQATDYGEDGNLLAVMFRCTPEQAVEATLGPVDTFTREDVESAFVRGYSLGCLPVGSDPQWDENRQTVDEHMEELGWVRADTMGRGECQVDVCERWLPATRYYRCKTCGAFFAVMDASGDIAPRGCPNCGRKISE